MTAFQPKRSTGPSGQRGRCFFAGRPALCPAGKIFAPTQDLTESCVSFRYAKSIQTKDNHSERERETNGPHISQ